MSDDSLLGNDGVAQRELLLRQVRVKCAQAFASGAHAILDMTVPFQLHSPRSVCVLG